MAHDFATVGVAENSNAAVLVTMSGGKLLDRRQVALTSSDLPTHPHHHEGSWAVGRYLSTPGARSISLREAVALVEQVHAAATHGAEQALAAVAAAIPMPIAAVAIRICPELPASIEERIRDHRAQTVADSVMYRQAIATAVQGRGWRIYWYDRDRVFRGAAAALGRTNAEGFLQDLGKSVGPPWQARHRLAAAAAMAATAR